MNKNTSLSYACELMSEFANQTGLSPSIKPPRRYLWTDAFAVCNFLELYRQTNIDNFRQLALLLVTQEHTVLGRHRDDEPRAGWISGLTEQEGHMHPTQGGLRIGKNLPERNPLDPYDENLEWDRDGQYFHYLTKWMHALNQVSAATADPTYNRWAIELAKTAHAHFTYMPSIGTQKYMYWKMSIDLSRPLVESMGQHDPLDGYITYNELQLCVPDKLTKLQRPNLITEIDDIAAICEGKTWVTNDPLGIGGLLCDAFLVAQMIVVSDSVPKNLLEILLESSLFGLESYTRTSTLHLPVEYRLAFREFGLSIGLRAIAGLQSLLEERPDCFSTDQQLQEKISLLLEYTPLAEEIESFWMNPIHQETQSWLEHRDINMVMLATSLRPDGFLRC